MIEEKICDFGIGNTFLVMKPETQITKKKDKFNFMKIKNTAKVYYIGFSRNITYREHTWY